MDKKIYSILCTKISTKTYIVGTQKHRLNTTVLFSTKPNVKTDG